METKDGKPVVYAANRLEWRAWLKKNSRTEKSVWLVLQHKSSKLPGISYNDAIEEALCYGWIDSLANKRDTGSYYLTFTPRKPKSKWSQPNRDRVAKMITEGLMTQQGLAMVDIAKSSGTWEPMEKEK